MNEPTKQELEEAEALRRALEEGRGGPEVPEDALEAAALLRIATGRGELEEAAAGRVLEEVLARQREVKKPRRFGFWLAASVAVPALALLAVVGVSSRQSAPVTINVSFPAPPADVMRAQLALAAGKVVDGHALEKQMRVYRGTLLSALEEGHER
jgi:hypothetical protein